MQNSKKYVVPSNTPCVDGITLPSEIQELEDGTAIAIHPDYPDATYPSLAALSAAYRLDTTTLAE